LESVFDPPNELRNMAEELERLDKKYTLREEDKKFALETLPCSMSYFKKESNIRGVIAKIL
jgi:hypothetical protein